MNDLNDIYYFAKIVEHGSLSAASEALGVAKSVLSNHLTKLESHLGVRLMQRTTRRLRITEVGSRYYERCRVVLQAMDHAGRVIDDVRETPRGKLHIACPLNFAQIVLAPVLTGFMKAYPEVAVRLDITNREVDLIADGYDLALRIAPGVRASNLVVRAFNLQHNLLVASPALLARCGVPRTPDELASMPSVAGTMPAERGGRFAWHLSDRDGRTRSVSHEPALVTEDLWVVKAVLLEGCGVGELPPLFCRDALADGRLVRVLPEWSLPMLKLHAVYPSRRGLTVAMRTLLEYLSNHLRSWIDTALNGNFELRVQRVDEAQRGAA